MRLANAALIERRPGRVYVPPWECTGLLQVNSYGLDDI